MFPLSVSVDAITSLLGIGSSKPEPENANGADGFAALLDIGTETVDATATNTRGDRAFSQQGEQQERRKEQDPQPVAVELATPLRAEKPMRYNDSPEPAARIEARQVAPDALKDASPEREAAQALKLNDTQDAAKASSSAPEQAPTPVAADAQPAAKPVQPQGAATAEAAPDVAATSPVAAAPVDIAPEAVAATVAAVPVAPVATQTAVAAVVSAQDITYMIPAAEPAAPAADIAAAALVDGAAEALPADLARMLASLDKLLGDMNQFLKDTPMLQAVEMGTGRPLGAPIVMGKAADDLKAMLQQFLGNLNDGMAKLLASAPGADATSQQAIGISPDLKTSLATTLKQLQTVMTQMAAIDAPKLAPTSNGPAAAAPAPLSALNKDISNALAKLYALVKPEGAADVLPATTLAESDTSFFSTADLSKQLSELGRKLHAIAEGRVPADQPSQQAEADVSLPLPTTQVEVDTRLTKDTSSAIASTIAAKAGAEMAGNASVSVVAAAQPVAQQQAQTQTNPVSTTAVAHAAAITEQARTVTQSAGSSGDFSNNANPQPQVSSPLPGGATVGGQVAASEHAFKHSFAGAMEKAANPAPLHEQVAFQVKTALADGSSKISIRLDPAELGKLDIKLNVGADGKTGVVITADHRSTLDLLQRDAQGLMRALADAGLQADSSSLSFNLRGGQQDGQQHERAQVAQHYQKAQPEDESDLAANVLTRSYVVNLASGLDIKI